MLSQAVYGSELGYPRAFLVSDSGLIHRVFPASMLLSDDDITSLTCEFPLVVLKEISFH